MPAPVPLDPVLGIGESDEMSVRGPIGVIFDMDGVLVDSARAHFESWRRLGEEDSVSVTRERFAETFGRQNRDIIPMLFGSVSMVRMAALSERKEEIYRGLICGRVPAVDGAVELVGALANAGVSMAIGSSAPRANIDLMLTEMGVVHFFDTIISADDATRGKPDPQVFIIACERLKLPPSRCVVVEDAPAGVEAAIAAGATAVAVLMHHPRAAFDGAALVVDRLSDLSVNRVLDLVG